MRAFTKKREGPASDALVVTTDSVAPNAPKVTNISCSETHDQIRVEWRRPDDDDNNNRIAYYKLRLKAVDPTSRTRDREIRVDVVNDTYKHVAYLSNLTTDAAYDLTLVAFVESAVNDGSFYDGPPSQPRRVFVGKRCDPLQAFSKVPGGAPGYKVLEYNAGILAGVIGTASILVFIMLMLLVCR